MNGSLRVEGEHFVLKLLQRSVGALPTVGGFFGASQFWSISGIIENSLPFRCRSVPDARTLTIGAVSTNGAQFAVDRSILASDPSTHEETVDMIRRIEPP